MVIAVQCSKFQVISRTIEVIGVAAGDPVFKTHLHVYAAVAPVIPDSVSPRLDEGDGQVAWWLRMGNGHKTGVGNCEELLAVFELSAFLMVINNYVS